MDKLLHDINSAVYDELCEMLELVTVDELEEQLFGVVHRALSRLEPFELRQQVQALYEHTIGTAIYFVPIFDEKNIQGVVNLCTRRMRASGLYEEMESSFVCEELENMMITL